MSTKQQTVAVVPHLNRLSPFCFCVGCGREAFHPANLPNKDSKHETFHSINLSNVCIFIVTQVCSDVTRQVFEAGRKRSPIVVRQLTCFVDILKT